MLKKSLQILRKSLLLIAVVSVGANQLKSQDQQLTWTKQAAGVWKALAGNPEAVNFTTISGVSPKLNALNAMEDVAFPLAENEIKAVVFDGKTYLQFPLDTLEKVFGFGLNFKTVEQRGRILRLHVDHYGGEDNGRTHAPVPFYVSSKGYGVFINSARYIDVWAGTAVTKDSKVPMKARDRNTDRKWTSQPYSDNVSFLIPVEGVEIMIFGGPTALDAVSRFNLFNGGGCMPPRWGLGFWHRTPTLYSDQKVLDEIAEFKKHEFPLSVIGLEPGWQSKSYPCTYEWDPGRFPEPAKFIAQLKSQGIQTNLWINPYISPESQLINKIKPYTASHTVWNGFIPDYGLPQINTIIGDHMKKYQLDLGVSGFKMDENDGYDNWLWPDVTLFPSKIPAEQMAAIRAQMNPHFLFNSLNSVQNLIQLNKNQEAHLYLADFAGLIRKVLRNSDKEEVSLAEELEMVEQYLNLEKLRFDFNYEVNVEDGIDPHNTMVPSILLQPFAENAVIHGLKHKLLNRQLKINITRKKQGICISIEDNGIGREASQKIAVGNNGKSTNMIKERLAMLQEKQGEKYQFEITDLDVGVEKGTRVEILIPDEV